MSVQAGAVKKTGENTYQGSLQLLTYRGNINIVPCTSQRQNAPDMVVMANGIEIGSARNRIGKTSNKEHVSIALKHPQVTGGQPVLYANLGVMADQDEEDVFAVILN